MYTKINSNIDNIIINLNPQHVSTYDWLKKNLHLCDVSVDLNYQKKYRSYWVMRYISPDSKFNDSYFKYLEEHKNDTEIDFLNVCQSLSNLTVDANHSKESFQFSFITKLIHMIDSSFPIFDSMVRDFYRLPTISGNDIADKIIKSDEIINTLKKEQKSVLLNGSLDNSILKFKSKYPKSLFSQEKILDSLILAYISQAKKA